MGSLQTLRAHVALPARRGVVRSVPRSQNAALGPLGDSLWRLCDNRHGPHHCGSVVHRATSDEAAAPGTLVDELALVSVAHQYKKASTSSHHRQM